MIGRLAGVAVWLAIGAAILSGLYWLFLNTPESNATTLTVSALLVVAMVLVAAVWVNAGILIAAGTPAKTAVGGGARGVLWFVLAALLVAAAWWLFVRANGWVSEHQGEISAWFIARFGWSNVEPLFQVQTWINRWLRWLVVPLVALSLLAALLRAGWRALGSSAWIRRALHWRTLAVASLVFIVLWALPWQLTTWKPPLPATWVEPTVAALRLMVVAVLAVVGAALLVALASAVGTTAVSRGREQK